MILLQDIEVVDYGTDELIIPQRTVQRDEIYVGHVVRTDRIYRYKGDSDLFGTKLGQLDIGAWKSYRSMLFVPSENKLSRDLLYNSPNYPILNVTDDKTCLNLGQESIVIKDACNLAELLKYYGYEKNLTFEDIINIRKTFFTGRFAKDNCELFGFKETKPEDWTYYENGIEITNPKKLKKRMEEERLAQEMGCRCFSGISEHVLPKEYFDILDSRGDNDWLDVLLSGHQEKRNAFSPDKEEGKIKKLRKFDFFSKYN